MNLGKNHLSHQNWENQIQSKNTRSPLEIDRFKTIINISVIALTFTIAQKYMHQCVNIDICNFADWSNFWSDFHEIFIKLYSAKRLGMLFTILRSFCSFLDWEGTDTQPQIRPRKISGHWFRFSKKYIS